MSTLALFEKEVIEKAQALVKRKMANKGKPVGPGHGGEYVFKRSWTYAEKALALAVIDLEKASQ
jgi:hypothetical protein